MNPPQSATYTTINFINDTIVCQWNSVRIKPITTNHNNGWLPTMRLKNYDTKIDTFIRAIPSTRLGISLEMVVFRVHLSKYPVQVFYL